MNPEPDHDLRARFTAQRRADHEHTPAWNPGLLRPAVKRAAWHMPLWLPITVAACVLFSFVWLRDDSAPAADLVQALPEFFTTKGDPLFVSLTPPSASPSDSFLPFHLTIQLP